MKDFISGVSLLYSALLHIAVTLLAVLNFSFISNREAPEEKYALVMDMVDISTITNLNVKKEIEKKSSGKMQAPKEESSGDAEISGKVENILENKNKVSEKNIIAEKDAQEKKSIPPKSHSNDKSEGAKAKIQTSKAQDKKQNRDNFLKELSSLLKEEDKSREKSTQEHKKSAKRRFSNTSSKSLDEGGKIGKKHKANKSKEKSDLNSLIDDALLGDTNTEYNPDIKMTISEIDAIKSKISRAWNTNAFADNADAANLKIKLLITLDKSGKITSARRISGSSLGSFVESAIRAVYDAEPLPMPSRAYEEWKEIRVEFNSNGLIY